MSKITKEITSVVKPDREITVRQVLIGLGVSLLIRLGVSGEHAANIATLAAPALLVAVDKLAFWVKTSALRKAD